MRTTLGSRVMMAIFLAVLLPLELGQCAFLMPLRAMALATAGAPHTSSEHSCCEGASTTPAAPTSGAPCCEYTPLPAMTAASTQFAPGSSVSELQLAVQPEAIGSISTQGSFIGLRTTASPGAPPGVAIRSTSPRGPPDSA